MIALSLLLAVAAPAAGPCDAATSTMAIVSCWGRQTERADARLNTAYRDARARVSAAQARSLQTAQRAWIAFRDANCRAYAAGEGTVTRIETAQCMFQTTATRAAELEHFAVRQ